MLLLKTRQYIHIYRPEAGVGIGVCKAVLIIETLHTLDTYRHMHQLGSAKKNVTTVRYRSRREEKRHTLDVVQMGEK